MTTPTLRYAAKALIMENGRILCLRKQGDIGGYYVLPGGGQEPGELLDEALKRECLEELGARVAVGQLRFVQEYVGKNHLFKDVHGHMHFVNLYFDCKLLEPALSQQLKPDAGQVGLEWLDVSQLTELAFFPRVLAENLGMHNGINLAYLGDSV